MGNPPAMHSNAESMNHSCCAATAGAGSNEAEHHMLGRKPCQGTLQLLASKCGVVVSEPTNVTLSIRSPAQTPDPSAEAQDRPATQRWRVISCPWPAVMQGSI